MSQGPETPEDKEFYCGLNEDTMWKFKEVRAERDKILARATQLEKFEYLYLDNDRNITELEKQLRSGGALLDAYGEVTKKKYGNLVPPRTSWRTRQISSTYSHGLRSHAQLARPQFSSPATNLITDPEKKRR